MIGPSMLDQTNAIAWDRELIHFPDRGPGKPETWLLGVACFYLTNSERIQDLALAEYPEVDESYKTTFESGAVPAQTQELIDKFDHGLVQFWRFSDPSERDLPAASGGWFQPVNTTSPFPLGYPAGSSTFEPLVFDDHALPAGSSAWELSAVEWSVGGSPVVLLFCADFGGHVLVYDVTDVPEGNAPVFLAEWAPPKRYLDNAHYLAPADPGGTTYAGGTTPDDQLNTVWSIAVDEPETDRIQLYAGVQDYGVVALTFKDLDPGPAVDLGFDDTEEVRIETPGIPFCVRIPPESSWGGRFLLVNDGLAGLRLYTEE